jgi:propionate CoA-transferase
MPKFIEVDEAVKFIEDGCTVYTCGFGLAGFPEEISISIEKSFLETGRPRELTLYHSTGVGNFKGRGIAHYAHEGLLKRIVAGHFGASGKGIQNLMVENKLEAYNLPQGVLATLPRDIAARRPGVITKVGLGTYVDPRLEGGRVNEITKEDIVEVIELGNEEWLFYKAPKVDVAIIRGTTADERGNITIEKDGILVETLSVAQAARACGGIVIAEVERIAKAGTLHPKHVKVPGIMVDYVVLSKPENHFQTMGTYFNPAYSGDIKIPVDSIPAMELSERKVVCRRAAMELRPNEVVNLGIGMPDGVSAVAAEENISHLLNLTLEAGGIGGVPAQGLDFANAINADAIIEQPYQFDFYDGGGLDITFLGLAQTDFSGNVNVSKFNGRVVGCGGFINITQSAKTIVFCGTFTADGLKLEIKNGQLNIINEGKNKKFLNDLEQITFSGDYAVKAGKRVVYVTERAVFELTDEGLELIEIAPGVNLEKDILDMMDFKPIVKNVKLMPVEIFRESWGGLADIVNSKQ